MRPSNANYAWRALPEFIFQSVANQSYFILARDAIGKPSTLSEEQHAKLQTEMKRRLESEIALARELFSMVREDSCIGFEPATQYFYLPLDLVEKVINCRWLLTRLDGKESRKRA